MREPMRQIRLVTEDNVVQIVREASTFDQAWSCRAGMMKKRGDGSDKTRKLWERHAKKVGSARLLEALKAYLREKEPTCGFCGLSVWLNGEKYDHWLEDNSQPQSHSPRKTFPEPHRASLVAALGESFVVSYCDPATVHPDMYITPRTETAKAKLYEKRHELRAAGIAGIRSKV